LIEEVSVDCHPLHLASLIPSSLPFIFSPFPPPPNQQSSGYIKDNEVVNLNATPCHLFLLSLCPREKKVAFDMKDMRRENTSRLWSLLSPFHLFLAFSRAYFNWRTDSSVENRMRMLVTACMTFPCNRFPCFLYSRRCGREDLWAVMECEILCRVCRSAIFPLSLSSPIFRDTRVGIGTGCRAPSAEMSKQQAHALSGFISPFFFFLCRLATSNLRSDSLEERAFSSSPFPPPFFGPRFSDGFTEWASGFECSNLAFLPPLPVQSDRGDLG